MISFLNENTFCYLCACKSSKNECDAVQCICFRCGGVLSSFTVSIYVDTLYLYVYGRIMYYKIYLQCKLCYSDRVDNTVHTDILRLGKRTHLYDSLLMFDKGLVILKLKWIFINSTVNNNTCIQIRNYYICKRSQTARIFI